MGSRSFSMTSMSPLGRGRDQGGDKDTGTTSGYAHANDDSKLTQNGVVSSSRDAPGVTDGGTLPLPIPPLYRNSHLEDNATQRETAMSGRATSSVIPFIQSYVLHLYIRLARILNDRFNLDLPVDFDIPLPHAPGIISKYKPTIWHVLFILLPIVFIFRRVSRRPGGQGGAGEAARLKLKAQRVNATLALGPYLGVGFWKAAMRAVGDAVSMGGRGLI